MPWQRPMNLDCSNLPEARFDTQCHIFYQQQISLAKQQLSFTPAYLSTDLSTINVGKMKNARL